MGFLTGLQRCFSQINFIKLQTWIRLWLLLNPGASSPKTPYALSNVVPSLTEKNSRKLLLPQLLVSLSWDSSDSSSNSFIFPSTTSLWGHKISSEKIPGAKILLVGLSLIQNKYMKFKKKKFPAQRFYLLVYTLSKINT